MRRIIRLLLKNRLSVRKFYTFQIIFQSSQFLDLFFGKRYEMHIYDILESIIDMNNKTILDIGANIGQTALSLKSIFPQSKVISYEPGRESYRYLKINQLINNLDIICINSAVVGASLNYTLIEDEVTGGRTSFINEIQNGSSRAINLNIALLEEEISKYNPALIKIDIEGFEWELLKPLKRSLFEEIYLLIELRNKTVLETFDFFKDSHKAFDLKRRCLIHSTESLENFIFGDILFMPIKVEKSVN